MANRTPPEVEERIIAMAKKGMTSAKIAKRLRMSARTVRGVLQRAGKSDGDIELPALADRRISQPEVNKRIKHMRECSLVLAESAQERLAANLAAGRQTKDVAMSFTALAREMRELDAYCRLVEAMPRRVPHDEEKREDAYVKLLWVQASSGNMAAAKLLAKAWGIEQNAAKANLEFGFDDEDSETDEEDTSGAVAAPSA